MDEFILKDWNLTIRSESLESGRFVEWLKQRFFGMFSDFLSVEGISVSEFVNNWDMYKRKFNFAFSAMKTVYILENL